MKRWKCSVCGYIHKGDEPPDKCPVCGAPKEKFIELPSEEPQEKAPEKKPAKSVEPIAEPERIEEKPFKERLYNFITDQMVKQHAHPISVHIPNGVLPLSVLFLLLATLFGSEKLELAAAVNMVFVLLAMPLVLFSGYNDWQKRYGGNITYVFLTKLVCGGVVASLALVLVVWRFLDPGVAAVGSETRGAYIFIHIVILAAAAIAGYMGGKLIFPNSE